MARRNTFLKEAFEEQVKKLLGKNDYLLLVQIPSEWQANEIPTYQAYNAWPMDGFCQEKWEVAHHVDDQRLDDSRFFGELKEESGQATNNDPDCLVINQFTQIRIKVFK